MSDTRTETDRGTEPGPVRHAGARLAVVTPWYPCAQRPFAGAFVQAATDAVAEAAGVGGGAGVLDTVHILHGEDWPGPRRPFAFDLARTSHARLAGAAHRARLPVSARDLGPEGRPGQSLLRVPVPVRPGGQYAEWALAHEAALRAALPDGAIDADVVHGHVGIYGGWVACRLARPGARVVVTEHASFLPRALRQRGAREMYREVLERADAFLCVSALLRDQLAARFPALADKVRVVPNLVDTERLEPRPDRVTALRRWLFLGNLAPSKGVPELLEAFARVAAAQPDMSLTLVGSGQPETVEELRRRARQLGVGARVDLHGPVPPGAVPDLLRGHDLLAHPSKWETFGMTTAEAVAVGTPVLVTRCGGPEQTLDGLEPAAGRLIDVSDDPQVIVDGFRQLSGELDRLDPARARRALTERYGRAAVVGGMLRAYGLPDHGGAARLRERPDSHGAADGAPAAPQEPTAQAAAAGTRPGAEPTTAATARGAQARPAAERAATAALPLREPGSGALPERVAFLVFGESRQLALREESAALLARGIAVDVFSLDPDVRGKAGLDPRVAVHTVGSPTARPRSRRRAALGRTVRGLLLARLAARRLAAEPATEVVVADAHAYAAAWRIARRCRDTRLRPSPDRLGNGWTARPADRAAAPPASGTAGDRGGGARGRRAATPVGAAAAATDTGRNEASGTGPAAQVEGRRAP